MASTRLQLLDRAAIRADMDSSGFPTAAQRITTLNEQVTSLWSWMINANYPAKRVSVPITSVTNGGPYPLSQPDLLRIVAVRDNRFPSSGMQGWLKRANDLERAVTNVGVVTPFAQAIPAVMYDVEVDPVAGPSVRIVPPVVTGSFIVECLIGHPGLSTDGAIWYGPAPSDEVLVLRTAAAWKEKEDPVGAGHLRAEAADRLSELWQVCQALATPQQQMDFISMEEPCYGRH